LDTNNLEERFQQLCEYKVQSGHFRVSVKYSEAPKLGQRVLNQRYNYRLHQGGKKTQLNAERIRKLVDIGFD
jgi:hypothetical protein